MLYLGACGNYVSSSEMPPTMKAISQTRQNNSQENISVSDPNGIVWRSDIGRGLISGCVCFVHWTQMRCMNFVSTSRNNKNHNNIELKCICCTSHTKAKLKLLKIMFFNCFSKLSMDVEANPSSTYTGQFLFHISN